MLSMLAWTLNALHLINIKMARQLRRPPRGAPQSRNHATFFSAFSRIHAINEKLRFSRKNGRKLEKNMLFTKSRMFLSDFTKSHTFFEIFSITHASQFTQSRKNKIVFTISRNKKRHFTQSRNPIGGPL